MALGKAKTSPVGDSVGKTRVFAVFITFHAKKPEMALGNAKTGPVADSVGIQLEFSWENTCFCRF